MSLKPILSNHKMIVLFVDEINMSVHLTIFLRNKPICTFNHLFELKTITNVIVTTTPTYMMTSSEVESSLYIS